MKKILYVVSGDPSSRKSWSGVLFSIKRELEKYFIVDYVIIPTEPTFGFKVKNKITRTFFKKNWMYTHSLERAKIGSKLIENKLSESNYDAIFAIDAAALTFVDTDVPVVYYSDGIASKMINYYWFNLSKGSIKQINFIQQKSLDNSDVCVFTNKWAADGAVNDYNVPNENIKIIHTGANLENDNFESVEHENVNLLFCGVDWDRKGGDMAVQTLKSLNKLDPTRKYVLHMYGCNPPYEIEDENIKLYGFLNRDISNERKVFDKLWSEADFFVSPLKADCAAASFCEACAYSVPSVTFDTGGIGDHVINDYNGFRLPVGSNSDDFANVIIGWMDTPGKLDEMKKIQDIFTKPILTGRSPGKSLRKLLKLLLTNLINGSYICLHHYNMMGDTLNFPKMKFKWISFFILKISTKKF